MGYRVEYESIRKTVDRPFPRVGMMTAACFIGFCLLVNTFWPRGRQVLQEILWPGNMAVTQQALEVFVTEIRYGEPVSDAVESFCREILKNENLS